MHFMNLLLSSKLRTLSSAITGNPISFSIFIPFMYGVIGETSADVLGGVIGTGCAGLQAKSKT